MKLKEILKRYGKSVDDIFQLVMSARGVIYRADQNYTWSSFNQVEMDLETIDIYFNNSKNIIITFHDNSTLERYCENEEFKWTYRQ